MINKRNFLTLLGFAPVAVVAKESDVLLSKPVDEWRPIETAPKDQVIMLHATKGNQAEYGQRVGIGKFSFNWIRKDDDIIRHCFDLYEYKEQDGTIASRIMEASHWMPLPEPPKEKDYE